ncbi:hypothetical protein FACS1894189_7390 [Planctomycetales bacterium]|nr:hypothetical protein FACS1894189_7390 [Planctomycetales bacterium]
MSEPTLQEILPADIVFNAGTQARVQTDQKTVQAYAESMRDGIEFPPIDVFTDSQSGQCILADGFHRYTAHISIRPNEPIKCLVHEGDVEDARIFACRANVKHGLRRTNDDKRKATKILLKEPKCQEWSNVKIADYVKVSEALVRKLRAEFELTSIKTKSTKRVGRDGRVTETKNIGRSYAFDEEPEPESNYRTNADGRTVNVRGFDFEAHRKCEDCIKWNPDNGYCMRDEKRQPSWSPACADFDSRKNYQIPEERIQTETLSTRPKHIAKNPHGEHALHIREKSVKCKLYPQKTQLSAVELRANFGEGGIDLFLEFLVGRQEFDDTVGDRFVGRSVVK